MPTPRETIAGQLRTDLTTWDVYDYPFAPAEVTKPATAVVYRSTVKPAGTYLEHELTLQVYGRGTLGAKTEADLDSRLDDVMLSLQRLAGVEVLKAERKQFLDVFQGWELDLKWVSSDIYKSQV
jgi:trans-2-enoyl-CoA reductase